MHDYLEFLGALSGEYQGGVVFDLDGEETITRDKAWISENLADLLIIPVTEDDRLLFVWAFMDRFDPEELDEMRLPPTAVLTKGGDAVVFWALEEPVALTQRVRRVLAHIDPDMGSGAPLPGSKGWTALKIDPDVFYPYSVIAKAYGPAQKIRKIGEAIVHGKFDEDDERLNRMIKVSLGNGRDCKKWTTKQISVADLIAVMSVHSVGPKDGPAMVLGDLAGGRRVKTAVKAAYGIGLDVDVGMSGEELDAMLQDFGCLAIRHTTHSHMKTITSIKEVDVTRWLKKSDDHDEINDESVRDYLREKAKLLDSILDTVEIVSTEHRETGVMIDVAHAPIEKHRIIFPFDKPFIVADQGGQDEALKLFKKMPARLASRIGAIPIDMAATDPSRLFYLPRHDKGNAYNSAIFGGPMLDWESLVKLSPMEEIAERITIDSKVKAGKTQTPEGKKLIKWAMREMPGFQLADVIRAFADDMIRADDGIKVTTECPFDEYHSNAGDPDDVGFFACNAGEGTTDGFVAHCQHDSCKDYSALDFLARMIELEWFGEEVLRDDEFNILDHGDEDQPDQGDAGKSATPAKKEKAAQAKGLEKGPRDERDRDAGKTAGKDQDTQEAKPKADANDRSKEGLKALITDALASGDNGKVKELMEEYLDNYDDGVAEEDLRDVFSRAKAASKFPRLFKMAKNRGVTAAGEKDESGRLVVEYTTQLDFDIGLGVSTKALKDLNKKDPNIVAVTDRPAKLVRLEDGTTQYEEMNAEGIWAILNETTCFRIRSSDGDKITRVPADKDVARQIFNTCYKIFPQAPEIIYTPVFSSDGTLIDQPGWYREEAIYMAQTDFSVPEVYADPEWDEVEEAVSWLCDELLVDFPFLDTDIAGNERREPSLANALSMLLTPFMRRMIRGTTPLFLVNKPVPGTGGTFLGSLPVKLCEGIDPTPLHYSQNDEEMQKALLASIMEAKSHLFFDNVNSFSSRVILAALTSTTIGGRILGQSKTVSRPNTFGWIATGNNPMLSEEMERRTVRINLNAKTTDIQLRQFKHGPSFPLENRARAVHCILTMIQWWISQGMPKFMLRKRASYEDWSEKVGGVLQACGVEGFLDNKKLVVGDMTEASLREFIMVWLERWGVEEQTTVMELFQHALDNDLQYLQGNNEDQKRSRFQMKLPSLNGRLFEIGGRRIMVRETVNEDQVPVFVLSDQTKQTEAA